MTTSVLIPSFQRCALLERCLRALAGQTVPPDEVIVVWQGDDTATRDHAEALGRALALPLHLVHITEPGIVPAENAALAQATGEIIFLIDDDAAAPADWVARHLAHYADASVGAVGGPAVNRDGQGNRFPVRAVEPIGTITWFGRFIGNMYDQPDDWRARPARDVMHLVGYNMSLRRSAFDRFEPALKRYWQLFEADACLQVRARGYRVRFDPAIVVDHGAGVGSASAYAPDRTGDLAVRVANAAYNLGFVLGKHSPAALRWVRWLYLMGVGTTWMPGPLLLPLSMVRYGHPLRELAVARMAWANKRVGWRAGRRARCEHEPERKPEPQAVRSSAV